MKKEKGQKTNVILSAVFALIAIVAGVFGFIYNVAILLSLSVGLLALTYFFARKYFYPLVSENKEFTRDMTVHTPCAKGYSQNILCLPLYAHLSMEDVDKICDVIISLREERRL